MGDLMREHWAFIEGNIWQADLKAAIVIQSRNLQLNIRLQPFVTHGKHAR